MAEEARPAKGVKLTYMQAHKVINWVTENHAANKGRPLGQVAGLVTQAMGFSVSADQLQNLAKEVGLKLGVRAESPPRKDKGVSKGTLMERVEALEEAVKALTETVETMREDLYGPCQQQTVIPIRR